MNADSMSRRCFLQVASAAVAGEALPSSAKTDQCFDKSPVPAAGSAPVVAPITDRRMRRASKAFVNQGGYNRGEGKRFTCPGASDGTAFHIRADGQERTCYSGEIHQNAGDFTAFDPSSGPQRYVVQVEGFEPSSPFVIADHIMERISSRLAYQFFIDCRGGLDSRLSPANVTGGGPCRDGGGQTLEATFEGLLYTSNPALLDGWFEELRRLRVEGGSQSGTVDRLYIAGGGVSVSSQSARIDHCPAHQLEPEGIECG
jgi:hypothetical protein